jgi:cyclopropane-fatty-acyl-phospholipid synthase
MISSLRPSPACAAGILRDVFGNLPAAFAFRLWDGQEVRWGAGEPACTAVITTPETFVQLMRDPTPYNFAVAYVEGAIDLEGDLFAAMEVANAVEEIRLSPMQKARLLLKLWRGRA